MLFPIGFGQDDSAQIAAAIKANGTANFGPGLFTVSHAIAVNGFPITIQGSGPSTIIRRVHNPSDYCDCLFSCMGSLNGLKIADLTYDGSAAIAANPSVGLPPLLLEAWGVCQNVNVGNVKLIQAMMPFDRQAGVLAGAVVHDCILEKSSAHISDGQAYQRCQWIDRPTITNECIVSGAKINLNTLEFNGTLRGIVFRNASNITADWLRFINVAGGLNAGELLSSENNNAIGLADSTINYVTAIGCDGAVVANAGATPESPLGTTMANVTFNHINQKTGRGIWLAGPTTQCVFNDVELELGPIVWFYPAAQNNTIDGLAIISPMYSQGNQRTYLPNTPFMPPKQAIIGAKGNNLTNVFVDELPDGWVTGL